MPSIIVKKPTDEKTLNSFSSRDELKVIERKSSYHSETMKPPRTKEVTPENKL